MGDDFIWDVRTFVYAHFAETTHARQADEIARHFDISAGRAAEVPDAVPGRRRWKDISGKLCLGFVRIIAALHVEDATIRSVCTASGQPLQIDVRGGQVQPHDAVVHFLVPFGRWYDDLVFT